MTVPVPPAPILVVVPVKGGVDAKSRLRAPDGVRHEALALALALDTVSAVAATPSAVPVVVTSDPDVVAALRRVVGPTRVVPDRGGGLNDAIEAGAAQAGPGRAVAALLGDLPALRPGDLALALAACADADAAFVPDAAGTGTVLLHSRDGRRLHPAFGARSAAVHADRATRLDLELPRLRRDVDDADDLTQAVRLGVGRHTRRALGLPGPAGPT